MPSPTPFAILAPDPTGVGFLADGTTRRQFTVRANVPVDIVVKCTSDANMALMGACPGAADAAVRVRNGDSIYLTACETGTGKVDLRHGRNVLKSYSFTIDPAGCADGGDMGILRLGEDVDAGAIPVWTHRCMEYRFLMESNGHIIAYLLSGSRDVSLELFARLQACRLQR